MLSTPVTTHSCCPTLRLLFPVCKYILELSMCQVTYKALWTLSCSSLSPSYSSGWNARCFVSHSHCLGQQAVAANCNQQVQYWISFFFLSFHTCFELRHFSTKGVFQIQVCAPNIRVWFVDHKIDRSEAERGPQCIVTLVFFPRTGCSREMGTYERQTSTARFGDRWTGRSQLCFSLAV